MTPQRLACRVWTEGALYAAASLGKKTRHHTKQESKQPPPLPHKVDDRLDTNSYSASDESSYEVEEEKEQKKEGAGAQESKAAISVTVGQRRV